MSEAIRSPSFPDGIGPLRSEQEVRAIRARRDQLEASMRAEDTPEWLIARNATDETAEKMLAYERQTMDFITKMVGGRP